MSTGWSCWEQTHTSEEDGQMRWTKSITLLIPGVTATHWNRKKKKPSWEGGGTVHLRHEPASLLLFVLNRWVWPPLGHRHVCLTLLSMKSQIPVTHWFSKCYAVLKFSALEKKWTERELTLYKSPHVEILSQKIIITKIPFTPRTSVTSKVFALLDFWVYELSPSSPEWADPSVSYKRCFRW